MGFFLTTLLMSGVVIFLVASLLQWIAKTIAPGFVASRSHIATTIAIVSIATVIYMYVMTRPSVVGPYEQWTLPNIGGQLTGGVLVAGLKIWTGRKAGSEH